jgi:thiamine-phosphate pyrophosphorylase
MSEDAVGMLWRTAQALAPPGRLPPLFFVTDPARTPDPAVVAGRLPRGAGVIYRAFGAADALETATRLARIAAARGLTLLIGLDADLAEACGAQGVHLPERALGDGPQLRERRADWILTGAAHGANGVAKAAAAGLNAALLSPVFASNSPSAGAPLGLERFGEIARGAGLPVYALGGVNAANAERLIGTSAAGIAAVSGLQTGLAQSS